MRTYKLVLLLKSSLKKDQKEKILDNVKKWAGETKNDKVDNLGEKKLAYIITKQKSADYVALNFETERVAQDLDKRILMEEDILRHLLIRVK